MCFSLNNEVSLHSWKYECRHYGHLMAHYDTKLLAVEDPPKLIFKYYLLYYYYFD